MSPDRLTATFAALADPTRRAILARLTAGEASVTKLAEPFDMSLPAVSKHLKVLERAGLIARGRQAQWRPCRLDAGPLKEIADWVEHYRRFWDESLDRLDDYLRELKTKERKHGRNQRRKQHRRQGRAVRRRRGSGPDARPPGGALGGGGRRAIRRRGARPHPHARRAARPRLRGLDDVRASRALVGSERRHHAVLQDGPASGWRHPS